MPNSSRKSIKNFLHFKISYTLKCKIQNVRVQQHNPCIFFPFVSFYSFKSFFHFIFKLICTLQKMKMTGDCNRAYSMAAFNSNVFGLFAWTWHEKRKEIFLMQKCNIIIHFEVYQKEISLLYFFFVAWRKTFFKSNSTSTFSTCSINFFAMVV